MRVKKKSKNGIFDFNIDIENMLDRPRVNQLFMNGLAHPLTVVHAPAGYGKTTAALQFAKNAKAQVVYMCLNELDQNPQYFWEHLSALYARIFPLLGARMTQLGFPGSSGLFMQIIDLFQEYFTKEQHVLVIDDFHMAGCANLEELLLKTASLRLKGLHIIILSRVLPSICNVDMKLKGLLAEINKEHLRFNLPELLAYCKLYDIQIGEADAQKINHFTEGWASAVYVSSLYFRQNPDGLLHMAILDINRLIENTVYKGYDPEVREFLLKLSILDRFDMEICAYLTGSKNSYNLLVRVLNENSFIKISEDKQYFEMHRLFRDFLQNKLSGHGALDKKALHIKAGEYYEYKNEILMALWHFDHAREYEKTVNLILKSKCASTFSNQELISVIHYMESIPEEYFLQYPMLSLILAMSYTRTNEAAKALELLERVKKLCGNSDMSGEVKNKLLGESAVIKSLISFNDTEKMVVYFKEACRSLPQGTELVGANWSYTFGCPSILYLYYNRAGSLDAIVNSFVKGFRYWEKLTSLGCGADFLLRAEAAFERGDYESAEQDAYRAIYRAEEKQQNAIVIAANLLIIKICAARGKYSNAVVVLRDMRELMNYRKALIYLSTMDMCLAVFHLLAGDTEDIPKWLAGGEMAGSAVNRAGFGMEFLIYAQVLLCRQEYLKLEHIVRGMFETYAMFSNQYGIIRTHLLAAIAIRHLYGLEEALPHLHSAFTISDADRLVMPYLEYGDYLLPLFQELGKQHDSFPAPFPRKWMVNMMWRMKEYQNQISRFRLGFNAAHPEKAPAGKIKLTRREEEILKLIVEGLSGKEIAKQLYVTPINIRVITSKIYKKLGVSSRVDAVRAAIDNGLVK